MSIGSSSRSPFGNRRTPTCKTAAPQTTPVILMRECRGWQACLGKFFAASPKKRPLQFRLLPCRGSGIARPLCKNLGLEYGDSWKRRKHHPSSLDVSNAWSDMGGLHVQTVQRPTRIVSTGQKPATWGRCRMSPAPPPPSAALSCSVLVLNRLYMAVHVVNVRRAFGFCAANWPRLSIWKTGSSQLFVRFLARDERIARRYETAGRGLDPLGQFRDSGSPRDSAAWCSIGCRSKSCT